MLRLCVFCAVIGIVFAISADQFPATIELPIMFYDYEYYYNQIINRINNQNNAFNKQLVKDMQEDRTDIQHCLCDFNICQQGNRSPSKYCPNHVHQDSQTGYIAEQLNSEGLPYLKATNTANKSYLAPHMWYKKNDYNKPINTTIILDRKGVKSSGVPMYQFVRESNFFMINGQGWDEGYAKTQNNYVFATHFKAAIKYADDANTLEISSDDDSWLFIDKQLAIDYGGTRAPTKKTFTIRNNHFKQGEEYQIDFFHADRCYTQASFTIYGPITCAVATGGKDTDKDGVPDCADGCYKEKYKVSARPGCTCEDFSKNCFGCEDITSESLCLSVEKDHPEFKCDWCAKAGTNGKCKDRNTCACEELPNDKCGQNNYTQCTVCVSVRNSSTKTCNLPEKCTCSEFKTVEACASANNKNEFTCIWCGNHCVDKNKDKCEDCTTFTKPQDCLSVFETDTKTKNYNSATSNCAWCTNGLEGNGKCVASKTDCACNDQTLLTSEPNAEICGDIKNELSVEMPDDEQKKGIGIYKRYSDFLAKKNRDDHYCDWCIQPNGSTCIRAEEKCNVCHLYDNDENSCLNAEGCSFCGNSCISSSDEVCDECSSFNNSMALCEKAYIGPYTKGGEQPSKCVFCTEGLCASNKDECETCESINSQTESFKGRFFTIGAEMSNCTKIANMEVDEASGNYEPILAELKQACENNQYCLYKPDNRVGSKCISKCEDVSTSVDCGNINYCKWSDNGNCIIKTDADIKNDLIEAISILRQNCLKQIANKCNFCGFMNFYYEYVTVVSGTISSRSYTYPNLCVAYDAMEDDKKCVNCNDIVSDYSEITDKQAKALPDGTYKIIHRLKGQTPQDNCHSLVIEYNSKSADEEKKYSGYQQCGYCEGTGNCANIEDPIEYFNIEDDKRADWLFYYKNCDVDCHLYKEDKYCSKSGLNCSWCKYPDGTANCTRDYEECPACKEYKSAYRCSDAGCRWCDLSSNCVTGNRDCPELPAIVGIAAGVIAAIIIAAVVGVALSALASKKIYDAINEARETSMDSATSNPLYAEAADGGSNPVFEAAE